MKVAASIILLLNTLNWVSPRSMHKYEVIVDYIDLPEGNRDKLLDYGSVRVKKYNRTCHTVDGDFELLQAVTNDLRGHVEAYVMQGNEYRKLAERSGTDLCDMSIKTRPQFLQYLRYTNIPENYTCPVLPQKYMMRNFVSLNNDYLPFEPPQGEKFRLNFTMYSKDDEKLADLAVYYILKKLPFSLY